MKHNRLILMMILSLLCLMACSHHQETSDHFTGKGLDELIRFELPEGYQPEGNDVRAEGNDALISVHYINDTHSIHFMMLSYKGKAVMGSDETIEEWREGMEHIADTVTIQDADSPAYIYPFGIEVDEKAEYEKSVIEAVFAYHDYLIMVGLEDYQGNPLSKDDRILFYNLLKSIHLKETP